MHLQQAVKAISDMNLNAARMHAQQALPECPRRDKRSALNMDSLSPKLQDSRPATRRPPQENAANERRRAASRLAPTQCPPRRRRRRRRCWKIRVSPTGRAGRRRRRPWRGAPRSAGGGAGNRHGPSPAAGGLGETQADPVREAETLL